MEEQIKQPEKEKETSKAIKEFKRKGKHKEADYFLKNKDNIEYAAVNVKVSRILINQICATMNGGSFNNGLAATTTLGCGSWGNNSISENLDYKHLINVSRIAYFDKEKKVPTDSEIWD